MQKLSMTLLAEINALQHLRVDELHAKYDVIIPELKSCRKCETLREEIAYCIQLSFARNAQFYTPCCTVKKIMIQFPPLKEECHVDAVE